MSSVTVLKPCKSIQSIAVCHDTMIITVQASYSMERRDQDLGKRIGGAALAVCAKEAYWKRI